MAADFSSDDAYSKTFSEAINWDEFYKGYWPDCTTELVSDLNLQRLGVDRKIRVPSRRRLFLVDEKMRRQDYGADLCLEEWSQMWPPLDKPSPRWKVGWSIDDKKICDFIAYGTPKRAYLIPFELLRLTMKRFLPAWKQVYPMKDVRNRPGYVTRNWIIPWDVFCAQMKLMQQARTPLVRPAPARAAARQLDLVISDKGVR